MDAKYVSLCQLDELVCLKVEHPKACALIALQGAQLLRYTPAGQQPVIWLSELAEFKKGQSVRGGIPICWPWFGDARRNLSEVQSMLPVGELPAHGWVRNKPWLLDEVRSDEEAVFLRFCFPSSHWPDPFPNGVELSLEMRIGAELELSLNTFNRSDQTVCLSQALHSYFAASDISNVLIKGLEGVRYIDTVDEWKEKSSESPITITGETDRIYVDTPELITVEDLAWDRKINISTKTAKSAVVWNPWIEKGNRLSQFADSAYSNMICVETAFAALNTLDAPTNQLTLIQLRAKTEKTKPAQTPICSPGS